MGEGVVVVVVEKAMTCHGWDAFPDLGEARLLDYQGGIQLYYVPYMAKPLWLSWLECQLLLLQLWVQFSYNALFIIISFINKNTINLVNDM